MSVRCGFCCVSSSGFWKLAARGRLLNLAAMWGRRVCLFGACLMRISMRESFTSMIRLLDCQRRRHRMRAQLVSSLSQGSLLQRAKDFSSSSRKPGCAHQWCIRAGLLNLCRTMCQRILCLPFLMATITSRLWTHFGS